MKKLLITFLIILFAAYVLPFAVCAADADDDLETRVDQLETDEWQNYIDQLGEDFQKIGEWDNPADLLDKILSNQLDLSYDSLWENILGVFLSQIQELFPMIVQLAILTMLYSILKNLTLLSGKVEQIAYLGGYIIFALILYNCFFGMITSVRDTVSHMNDFTELIMPPMVGLLASAGASGSAGVLQPASAMITGGISMLINNIIIPIIILWSVVLLINQFSEHMKLGEMAGFLKSCVTWGLGGVFTIFAGVIAVQGLAAAAYDGISIRAIKYALSSGVPIIGGMVGESVNMVLSCSILVKSAIGIFGIIAIIGMILGPCIKIVSIILMLKGFSAITAPFADHGITKCLSGITDVFKMLAVTIFGVAFIYFIVLTLAIGAGSSIL